MASEGFEDKPHLDHFEQQFGSMSCDNLHHNRTIYLHNQCLKDNHLHQVNNVVPFYLDAHMVYLYPKERPFDSMFLYSLQYTQTSRHHSQCLKGIPLDLECTLVCVYEQDHPPPYRQYHHLQNDYATSFHK